MPSVYIHLAGKDVDEAIFALNDMRKKSDKEEKSFKPNMCPRCDEKNSPDSKFCNRCGAALDIKKSLLVDETRAKLDKLLEKLTKDPEKLDRLLALVKAL